MQLHVHVHVYVVMTMKYKAIGFWLRLSCVYTILILIGNSCVLKPSEISLHTSNMFNELIPLYFDKVRTLYLHDSCTCTIHSL